MAFDLVFKNKFPKHVVFAKGPDDVPDVLNAIFERIVEEFLKKHKKQKKGEILDFETVFPELASELSCGLI